MLWIDARELLAPPPGAADLVVRVGVVAEDQPRLAELDLSPVDGVASCAALVSNFRCVRARRGRRVAGLGRRESAE